MQSTRALSLAILTFLSGISSLADANYLARHTDYRRSPRMLLNSQHLVGVDIGELGFVEGAQRAISLNKALLGVEPTRLRYIGKRRSLAGVHIRFQQRANGVDVLGSKVIVSIDERKRRVYQIYNNSHPGEFAQRGPQFSSARAYDIAWEDLRVHGSLLAEPSAILRYVVDSKGRTSLVYLVQMSVSAPPGSWQVVVDARTGQVIDRQDRRLPRKSSDKVDPHAYRGKLKNRRLAWKEFYGKSTAIQAQSDLGDGLGLIFDPDPKTTLNDETLTDESPAERFEGAYRQEILRDLRMADGVYYLQGPWVSLQDFVDPYVEPSTSATGLWEAKRGDVAFNDVMTYFHIDQSQRYLQSLGFVGDRSIQATSIAVDANGASGRDNSFYDPINNRIAFGHGCVDDNEDAAVILHEYGHAIQFDVTESWLEGDTGAIGEGFGDYWAGSYNTSTPSGMSFHVNRVFKWDGTCWGGRVLNATGLRYDHDHDYGAHRSIPGNGQSDELWSTPLFQSLLQLLAMGAQRSEVDQIVIEGLFGLGTGVKMRDVAEATIAAATRLQPDGPHASVFTRNFVHHGIVLRP